MSCVGTKSLLFRCIIGLDVKLVSHDRRVSHFIYNMCGSFMTVRAYMSCQSYTSLPLTFMLWHCSGPEASVLSGRCCRSLENIWQHHVRILWQFEWDIVKIYDLKRAAVKELNMVSHSSVFPSSLNFFVGGFSLSGSVPVCLMFFLVCEFLCCFWPWPTFRYTWLTSSSVYMLR